MKQNILDPEKIRLIVDDVKKKKELATLHDQYVEDQVERLLRQNQSLREQLQQHFNQRSAAYKTLIKQVRAHLRRASGLFRDKHEHSKRKELFEQLLGERDVVKRKEIHKQILNTHSSTKERLTFYNILYRKIFAVTGEPNVVLDVGSGVNPFSFLYMGLQGITYYAYDIHEEDVHLLNEYFQYLQGEVKFRGEAVCADIRTMDKFPAADIAFLFKVTDILDQGKGHKNTEEMICTLPVKYVVVSFPTVTMSGKPMRVPRRKWMEWMCQRLGYGYQILEFSTEIFYVVKK